MGNRASELAAALLVSAAGMSFGSDSVAQPEVTQPQGVARSAAAAGLARPAVQRDLLPLQNEVEVPLTTTPQVERRLRVVSGRARLVRDASGKTAIKIPSSQEVHLAEDTTLPTATLELDQREVMPGLLLKTAPDGGSDGLPVLAGRSVKLLSARPFVELAQAVRWVSTAYVARLLLGLDPLQEGDSPSLDEPMLIRVSASHARVDPAQVTIDTVGPKGYRTVAVSVEPPLVEQQQTIRVHTALGHRSFRFQIPRVPTSLRLKADEREVDGYGLETAEVHARLIAEDGLEVAAPRAITVVFGASRGELEPSERRIPKGASTTSVRYRAARGGTATIEAEAGGLHAAPLNIQVIFPWWAVWAALAGGTLGGLSRALRRTASIESIAWRSLEGVVAGALVAATVLAVPALVTVAGAIVPTVLGLFVVSALAGVLGTSLVERIAGKVFRVPSSDQKPHRQPNEAQEPEQQPNEAQEPKQQSSEAQKPQ